jgi:hypothetical protein
VKARARAAGRLRALRRPAAAPRLPGWVVRLGPRPVLAALLGLVLLAELLPGGGDDSRLPDATLPRGGGAVAGADVQGWTQTILARPLFNPDRLPSGEATGGGDGLPRLSAILIGQGMASAIFAADGQKPLVVQVGGLVNGDKVQSISADEVVLLTAVGPVALRPRFAKGAASAATPQQIDSAPQAASRGAAATPSAHPALPAVQVSPKTGQPLYSSSTAGPYDNE